VSIWTYALRAVQQATLLQYKVEQALKVAEEARSHSIATRERLIQLETIIDLAMKRPQPSAPPTPELPAA